MIYTGLHDKHIRRSLQWRNPRKVSRLEMRLIQSASVCDTTPGDEA